jgi:Tfp pilus assembly protein PilN
MIRINLLPHREQKRQARQRQFVSLAIGLAILGLAVVLLVHVIFGTQIENQQSRNQLLKTEIGKLDEQIKEIDKLREQTQALLARKARSSKRCNRTGPRPSTCSISSCASFPTGSICDRCARWARR